MLFNDLISTTCLTLSCTPLELLPRHGDATAGRVFPHHSLIKKMFQLSNLWNVETGSYVWVSTVKPPNYHHLSKDQDPKHNLPHGPKIHLPLWVKSLLMFLGENPVACLLYFRVVAQMLYVWLFALLQGRPHNIGHGLRVPCLDLPALVSLWLHGSLWIFQNSLLSGSGAW